MSERIDFIIPAGETGHDIAHDSQRGLYRIRNLSKDVFHVKDDQNVTIPLSSGATIDFRGGAETTVVRIEKPSSGSFTAGWYMRMED